MKKFYPYAIWAGELIMIASIPLAFIPEVSRLIVVSSFVAGLLIRTIGIAPDYLGNIVDELPVDDSVTQHQQNHLNTRLKEPIIHVRRATPNDMDIAAQLIHEAQHKLSIPINGLDSSKKALAFYRKLFVLPGTFWSYSISTVAEVDGKVVGLISHLPVASLHRTDGPTLRGTLATCGLFYFLRQNLRSRHVTNASPKIGAGCYYIIHLAVLDAYRGKGIGARLLREAHENGARGGYPFCVLHVEIENEIAQRFFKKYGYKEQARRTSDNLQQLTEISGFIGMTADLQSIGRIRCPKCHLDFVFHHKGWPPQNNILYFRDYICPKCGYTSR